MYNYLELDSSDECFEVYDSLSKDERKEFDEKMDDLLEKGNPYSRAYSGNFNFIRYSSNHKGTYSMDPKMSTRIVNLVALDGWNELIRLILLQIEQIMQISIFVMLI